MILLRIRRDRQQISLTCNWFGYVRYQVQRSSPRRTICKLGFILHYDTSSRVRLSNIKIWAGTRLYKLPTKHLTEPEIDWLAHELSKWSGVPITVEDARQEQEKLQELYKESRSSKDRS